MGIIVIIIIIIEVIIMKFCCHLLDVSLSFCLFVVIPLPTLGARFGVNPDQEIDETPFAKCFSSASAATS